MAKDRRDEFSKTLGRKAQVVIPTQDRQGGLGVGEVLAWRDWFDARQKQLKSSGGRPTNPKWSMKRQVPFSEETWRDLEECAEACSESGTRIGPGQLAAFLIEEAVLLAAAESSGKAISDEASEYKTGDPELDNWVMPAPFSGSGVP